MMDDIFLSRAALWHPDTSIVIMIPSHQIYFYFLFTTGTWASWELGASWCLFQASREVPWSSWEPFGPSWGALSLS